MMKDEQLAILDSLLAQWWQWVPPIRMADGFSRESAVVGEFLISKQYDDANGALDDDLDNRTMAAVGYAVESLEDPYRPAIMHHARSMVAGCEVILNPRLPADREARRFLIVESCNILLQKMIASGVI